MTHNWFQHTLSRRRFNTRNQAATLAILGVAIMLVLGSVYLSQVASFAITNRTIEDLIAQRDELKYTNEQLIAEIARYRTVPRLFARAEEIGFRPATNLDIDYVVIEGYAPDSGRDFVVGATSQSATSDAPTYDQTFESWLEQQLAQLRAQLDAFGN